MDIEKLLRSMTLREKLAQMTQFDAGYVSQTGNEGFTGPLHDNMKVTPDDLAGCGTILNCVNAADAHRLQEKHMDFDRQRIPMIFMYDVIHGFRTIFPIPLAMGCTFDEEAVREYGRVAAKEARASGIRVTFAPMLDLVRDARWGRVMESTGEDTWLNSRLAAAVVEGFQGDDLSAPDAVACCVKHFAGYGAPEGGRDYSAVEMGDYMLREFYLPAYKAALDAGAMLVMPSFNSVDGVPSSANVKLLRGILREEFGFDGVTVSDWAAVMELIAHGAAADIDDAARLGLNAGVDVEMMTTTYLQAGERLVAEGKVKESDIDDAVRRILRLKDKLGLFDDPDGGASSEKERAVHLCPAHREKARAIAAKSLVLLKNEGLLPLNTAKKAAVIGPYAVSDQLLGNWGGMGLSSEAITLKMGFDAAKIDATYTRGCDMLDPADIDLDAAVKAAKAADVVILALGETPTMSGESASRAFLELPDVQMRLLDAVTAVGKPTALLLFNGRPLELRRVADKVDAIVECWFPGTEAGNAIADLLTGKRPPEGRLSMSFPYTVGQCPVYYNHFNTGRPAPREGYERSGFCAKYIDAPVEPFYPFGYGLNYSPVTYGDTVMSGDLETGLTLTAAVKNEGRFPVVETAQLYVRDLVGSVVRPVRELRGICKVSLAPGETGEARFTLTAADLAFYHADGRRYAEPGDFTAYIGANCNDNARKVRFTLKEATR